MEPQQESLTRPEVNALLEALDDEFKAVATYQQVIDDFGPIRPFVNIIEAKRRHIEALRGLFNRYNLDTPADSWPGAVARFESVGDAYAAGVEGEIQNAAMYQRLIGATHHTDIIEVFENLQRASQDNHLLAFRRCTRRGDDERHQSGHPRHRRRRGNWASHRDRDQSPGRAIGAVRYNGTPSRAGRTFVTGTRMQHTTGGRSTGRSRRSRLMVGAALLVAAGFVAAGCGVAAGNKVADGAYLSLVPSHGQLALDVDGALPGGVAQLSEDGASRVEVDISGDQVLFGVDGMDTSTRSIVDRVDITDREGSGPFKAKKQILVLGDAPLVLGGLVINEPVIWPGSFEDSPVITIKSRDPDERGPGVSCNADQRCLLLSSGVDPAGNYADANNPELDENPIDAILINDESIDLILDSGDQVTISASDGSGTRACGLSETQVWAVPAEIGLAIDDPVLVHTLCPSTPGAAIQLVIMDRSAIPILAPLTEAREGDWCAPSSDCLLFVPTWRPTP